MFKFAKKYDYILFAFPAVVMICLTIYIPFVLSGYYSFTEWNGIDRSASFTGFSNYIKLWSDSGFLDSMLFTGRYAIVFIIFSNVLALALAVVLYRKLVTANLLRGVFFVPYIMSMTIVGFIWKFIFSQGFAKLYDLTSLSILNLSWLGDPKLAGNSVAFVGIWQSIGFYIVLYIAGLKAVPPDVLEAAVIDGANSFKRFFLVTLPLIGPSITTCVLMSLINSLKVFDIILALTKGGPGTSTYSVTLQIYREAFQNNNYGMGSAKSVVYFVAILALTQIVLKFFSKREVQY